MGMRSADMRRAEIPPATAATRATNCPPKTLRDAKSQTHGSAGRGVSFCVPGVGWRHPTQRRLPAGTGSLRTGGSQAEEGQDGFARVKSATDTPRRTARANGTNPDLSVDRTLLGTSTIGPHPARPVPDVAPRDPPRSAHACRSAVGRPILCDGVVSYDKASRGDTIRTCDLYVPNVAL